LSGRSACKPIQTLAINHGIVRLWTREEAPFWKQHGLQPANAETLKKLPPVWGSPDPGWLTLQLKSDESVLSMEKELAMFKEAEKQTTARLFEQARMAKLIVLLVAFAFGIIVIGVMFYLLQKNPNVLHQLGR
jgi:hypothetical protein